MVKNGQERQSLGLLEVSERNLSGEAWSAGNEKLLLNPRLVQKRELVLIKISSRAPKNVRV